MGGTRSDSDATVVDVERDERIVGPSACRPWVRSRAGGSSSSRPGWAGPRLGAFQGPFKLVASIDEPWATVGAPRCRARRRAGPHGAVHPGTPLRDGHRRHGHPARGATTTTHQRSDVDSAFMDGKALVLLDRSGASCPRAQRLPGRIASPVAVAGHGYAWRDDGDPYRDEFRLWVPDLPGLPPAANALLSAELGRSRRRRRAMSPSWWSSCCGWASWSAMTRSASTGGSYRRWRANGQPANAARRSAVSVPRTGSSTLSCRSGAIAGRSTTVEGQTADLGMVEDLADPGVAAVTACPPLRRLRVRAQQALQDGHEPRVVGVRGAGRPHLAHDAP